MISWKLASKKYPYLSQIEVPHFGKQACESNFSPSPRPGVASDCGGGGGSDSGDGP